MGKGLLLWEPLIDEDPVEEGCPGERQTRGKVESTFLSTPSPAPFEALSPLLLSGLEKEGRLSYSSMKIL